MLLILLMLVGGYLAHFVRFCDTFVHFFAAFWHVRFRFTFFGKMRWRLRVSAGGLPAWNSLMAGFFYCALLGNNHRQRWPRFVAAFAFCFVGFSDGAGMGGVDNLG